MPNNFEQLYKDVFLGNNLVFTVSELEDYVEDHYRPNLFGMVLIYNNSPKHDGNPAYDVFEERRKLTAEQFLDNEDTFQRCCSEFLQYMHNNELCTGN